MTPAPHLSERMPAVALGEARWSGAEREHLAGCAECAAEWEVVRIGSALGRGLEGEFDVDRAVTGVTTRLASEPARVLRMPRRRWLALAAAAAVLAVAVLRTPSGPLPLVEPGTAAPVQALLPELDGLGEDELEQVLLVLPAVNRVGPTVPGLGDLSEDELETVLETLEG